MTLSPVENPHTVKPCLDLPPYELNAVSAKPGDSQPSEDLKTGHHLFRRSLGAGFRDAWWVELEDGTVVPNRVGLSVEAHRQITENEARIYWNAATGRYVWLEQNEDGFFTCVGPLDPQPGVTHQHEAGPVAEGQPCPTCKRRVPHKKKPTSPKTKVAAMRVPLDDADTFNEMATAVEEHLGLAGKPHARYFATVAAFAVVLQTPKKELA